MVVIDASVLVDALLVAGPARIRLASDNLQAPELIDAELLSVLRRLVLADNLQEGHACRHWPPPTAWACAATPAAPSGPGPGSCAPTSPPTTPCT